MSSMKDVQAARLVLQTRNASLRMTARATPDGLLAIGGLVCGILLATAIVCRASQARRIP